VSLVEVRIQKGDLLDHKPFNCIPDAKAWILTHIPKERWGNITIFTDFGLLKEQQVGKLLSS